MSVIIETLSNPAFWIAIAALLVFLSIQWIVPRNLYRTVSMIFWGLLIYFGFINPLQGLLDHLFMSFLMSGLHFFNLKSRMEEAEDDREEPDYK